MALQATGNVGDEDILGAFSVLNTVIHFVECGDVSDLIENEIKNYFMMCQQIEIFCEKFMQKGYVLAHDKEKGAYLTATANGKVEFDYSLLADRLLEKFCHPRNPSALLSVAVRMYIDYYGSSRFARFLEVAAASKKALNLTTLIERASDNGYNLEGPVFMVCLEGVALGKKGGMARVRDFISEFLLDDLCANTIVDMLATENPDVVHLKEIKAMILEKLELRFSAEPKSRMWLKMVCSLNLLNAVNNYPPFMPFVLKLVGSLSESITYDAAENTYHSSPGYLTYNNLLHIMAKFYRNQETTQAIVNFVFNQFKTDPTVWGSVLTACHNLPVQPTTNDLFFESLYQEGFTDPNVSSESLQLMIKRILDSQAHQFIKAALNPPSSDLFCQCDQPNQQGNETPMSGSNEDESEEVSELSITSVVSLQGVK